MARWTTALVAAGMIAAVGIAALGCSMSQPTRAVVNVTSHDGGTVQLGGATLTLPPGAVNSTGQLVATTIGAPPTRGNVVAGSPVGLSLVASPVSLKLGNTTLTAPASLTMNVPDSSLPEDPSVKNRQEAVWLASYDTQSESWRLIHAAR